MDSARSPQVKLRYWEFVFFSGLFGVIVLYPFIAPLIPFVIYNQQLFILCILTSIAVFATIALYYKFYERRKKQWAVISAFMAACATTLMGYAALHASIIFTVWFIDATLTLFCFGYILARHFFQRVEKDFLYRWHSIILMSLAINFMAVIITTLAVSFPPLLIALSIGGLVWGSSFL